MSFQKQRHINHHDELGGYKYVPLAPVLVISTTGPANAAWTPLDLSGSIPVGAVAVNVDIRLQDNATDNYASLCQGGAAVITELIVYVAAEYTYPNSNRGVIRCSTTRAIDYFVAAGGIGSVQQFTVYLNGYYVPVSQAV